MDHVGHRYGPDHPAMKDKLAQMNEMLTDIVRLLSADEDTLLLVFGDHGMTPDGNHGGASPQELDAALFIYTAKEINHLPRTASTTHAATHLGTTESSFRQIKQTDLTATLALLLGIPIPFGNLGSIIPELFLHRSLPVSFGLDHSYSFQLVVSEV